MARRSFVAGVLAFATILGVARASAQATGAAQPATQFKANLRVSGGSVADPVTGTMASNGTKLRLELTMDGEKVIFLLDQATRTATILVPEDKMYAEMPPGTAPLSLPRLRALDPANPCGGSGVANCVRGGPETVSGMPAVKWTYEADGEKWTSWISTTHRLPVKQVSADGTTIEFSSIVTGRQDPALFSVPSDYQTLMGALAATASSAASAGVDPDMGPGSGSPWEGGDGWIVNLTITAGHTKTERRTPSGRPGESTFPYDVKTAYTNEFLDKAVKMPAINPPKLY
jgi:hypothetical protein